MTFVSFPGSHGDVAVSITPHQIVFDDSLLFRMRAEIGIVQAKLLERSEMTFDAIEPGRIGRCEIKANAVR